MDRSRRSNCPISFALDLIGDKWSLLVLRDVILLNRRYYKEFLEAGEGIATNILADRLKTHEQAGLITKKADALDRKKYVYRPTQKALDMLPAMVEIVLWGAKYDPQTAAPSDAIKKIRRNRDEYIQKIRANFT